MSKSNSELKEIHYVVVVHGIGEQRPNETVPAVISRFAEARHMDYLQAEGKTAKQSKINNFVSMGKVAAQAGTKRKDGKISFAGENPWSQFEGIPQTYGAKVGNFNAVQSEGEEDVRFIDMYWADILDDYFKISGQSVQAWTDSVLSRLTNSGEYTGKDKQQRAWIMRVLTQVQETALFATKVSALPKVNFADDLNHVLDNVVGDIQIYGENRSVRGEAVARFHNLMEKIHEQHLQKFEIYNYDASKPNVKQRYTIDKSCPLYADGVRYVRPKIHIVSHSLGTVMSMDAIVYAHVKKSVAYPNIFTSESNTSGPVRNLPFEMYGERPLKKVPWDVKTNTPKVKDENNIKEEEYVFRTEGECIGSNWIDNIESLVTLGSPVDKFLVLYPENYQYMNGVPHGKSEGDKGFDKSASVKQVFASRGSEQFPKIRHYNYCDEQDPVGHHLDLIKEKAAYNQIFDNKEGDRDVVFNQYVTPGVAHVKYWEDQVLMRRILHQTVDGDIQEEITNSIGKVQSPEQDVSAFTSAHSPSKNYAKLIQITYLWPIFISGLVMAGIFFWGWNSLKENPDDYLVPALAAFVFSMAGYFFRKIIALLVWWRQALRTKSTSNDGPPISAGEPSSKKDASNTAAFHNAGLSRNFRITINSGLVIMPLLSVLSISYAIVNNGTIEAEKGITSILTYFSMLVVGGLVVYLYGKMKWSRSYGTRTTTSKVPEWITVAYIVLITASVIGMVAFLSERIDNLRVCISDSVISAIAILMGGLTIAWIYVRYTLFFVKRELLNNRSKTQIRMGEILEKIEKRTALFFDKHLLHVVLFIFVIGLLYLVFGTCF